ncbi:sugar transferase [Dietzia kunjamensis]|uniref:sugar transferase n=1 Tax=Dietzia kunjamensis TaxID=322509 RepID=UPI003B008EBA
MRESEATLRAEGLTLSQRALKRSFDLAIAVPGLILLLPLVAIAVIAATIDTREWGVFTQERIGRDGNPFKVHKVRSMRTSRLHTTTVTSAGDPRITPFGALIRRTKIDELPQLWNVICGSMSLVGPRPDVSGWADKLEGEDRIILSIRPGITGPASLFFRDEESVLSAVSEPEEYNRTHIWPKKVQINKAYIQSWSIRNDFMLILSTIGYPARA